MGKDLGCGSSKVLITFLNHTWASKDFFSSLILASFPDLPIGLLFGTCIPSLHPLVPWFFCKVWQAQEVVWHQDNPGGGRKDPSKIRYCF